MDTANIEPSASVASAGLVTKQFRPHMVAASLQNQSKLSGSVTVVLYILVLGDSINHIVIRSGVSLRRISSNCKIIRATFTKNNQTLFEKPLSHHNRVNYFGGFLRGAHTTLHGTSAIPNIGPRDDRHTWAFSLETG